MKTLLDVILALGKFDENFSFLFHEGVFLYSLGLLMTIWIIRPYDLIRDRLIDIQNKHIDFLKIQLDTARRIIRVDEVLIQDQRDLLKDLRP